MIVNPFVLTSCICIALVSCNLNHIKDCPSGSDQPVVAYDFMHPDQLLTLPAELKEASGLAWMNEKELGIINDEEGAVYIVNSADGTITRRIQFAGPSDYEGIAITKDFWVVINSEGHLFYWKKDGSEGTHAVVIKPDWLEHRNIEGLDVIPSSNTLVIACKETAKKRFKNKKVFFAYDLGKKEKDQNDKPYFTLDLAAVERHIIDAAMTHFDASLREDFGYNDDLESLVHPSGITWHPIDQQWYILSSDKRLIIKLNPAFDIVQVKSLSTEQLPQPEGICVAPTGDIFIASEGIAAEGKVAVFRRS